MSDENTANFSCGVAQQSPIQTVPVQGCASRTIPNFERSIQMSTCVPCAVTSFVGNALFCCPILLTETNLSHLLCSGAMEVAMVWDWQSCQAMDMEAMEEELGKYLLFFLSLLNDTHSFS